MRFLPHPNLPSAPVRLCALAEGQPYIAKALRDLGVAVLPVGPQHALPEPVRRHPDLQLHHLGSGEILLAGENRPMEQGLTAHGFTVLHSNEQPAAAYPGDVLTCCFALGGVLYCAPEHTAGAILARHPRVQPVRQGYARCSTCIVDDGAIITADKGIADAARANGLTVLSIRPGHIALPGYAYGFIGGCSGLIGKGLLAFTGDLDTHPDGRDIRAFCRDRGVETVSLTAQLLSDIGGILPLIQD